MELFLFVENKKPKYYYYFDLSSGNNSKSDLPTPLERKCMKMKLANKKVTI
jgi:hypothetical protein